MNRKPSQSCTPKNASVIELISVGTASYSRKTYGPRRLKGYQFWWALEGLARLRLDGVWIDMTPGVMVLRQPGVEEYLDASESDFFLHGFVWFNLCLPRTGWPKPSSWPTHLRAQSDIDLLAVLPRYILDVVKLAPPLSGFLIGSALELLLRSFVTRRTAVLPSRPTLPEKILDAVRIMHDALEARDMKVVSIGLPELAQRLNLSVSRLSGLFHAHLNTGPMTALRDLRLAYAAYMLVSPGHSIKEVAQAAGFESQHHFARCFSVLFGISPSAYIRVVRDQWDFPYPEIVLTLSQAVHQSHGGLFGREADRK